MAEESVSPLWTQKGNPNMPNFHHATVANQPSSVVEMGISDILRFLLVADQLTLMSVIHPCDQTPQHSLKEIHLEAPAGRCSTAPGPGHCSWHPSWHRELALLPSRAAQCSHLVAMTPDHCHRVQTPLKEKTLSLILIKFHNSAHGSALVGSRACTLCWSHFCFVKKLKWFSCSGWRTEIVSTSLDDALPTLMAVVAVNQIERRKSNTTECQSYKTGFSLCFGLGFIAASNSSSRKRNFPILPFLVRQSVCGILPQRQENNILWVYFLN